MQHTNNEIMPNLINFGGDIGDLMRSPPNVLKIQIKIFTISDGDLARSEKSTT